MFPTMGLQALQRNPQLPQHPLGAYTDSMYEAQVAQLRADIMQQYNDILQQLGYTDESGNFVPGTVEIDANRQRQELNRNTQLADEQVTQQHQREGTLFSGLRGTNTARAEFPFQNALAELGVQVPRQLTDLYSHATGLINQFNTQHNLLLAEAAQRAAANLANNSAAGGANVTGASTGGVDTSAALPGGELPTIYAPMPGALPGSTPDLSGHPILEHPSDIPIMYPPAPAQPRPLPTPSRPAMT